MGLGTFIFSDNPDTAAARLFVINVTIAILVILTIIAQAFAMPFDAFGDNKNKSSDTNEALNEGGSQDADFMVVFWAMLALQLGLPTLLFGVGPHFFREPPKWFIFSLMQLTGSLIITIMAVLTYTKPLVRDHTTGKKISGGPLDYDPFNNGPNFVLQLWRAGMTITAIVDWFGTIGGFHMYNLMDEDK